MGNNSPERRSGCGLITTVFGRRSLWSRKPASVGSSPIANNTTNDSKRLRGGSNDVVFVNAASPPHTTNSSSHNYVSKSSLSNNNPQKPNQNLQRKQQQQHPSEITMSRGPSSSTHHGYVNQGRRVAKEAIGISGELESMINDHQKSKGSSTLVRASSSNVMLFGNLGNIKQGGGGGAMDYYHIANGGGGGGGGQTNYGMGHAGNYRSKEGKPTKEVQSGSLCRALSTRMDPEQLKIMGNEDYKNGRFAEALALYDAAIAIDPNKASYRSNRSAALTALGRLLEAVFECREAIRIEPHYQRAHNRLGKLHFR